MKDKERAVAAALVDFVWSEICFFQLMKKKNARSRGATMDIREDALRLLKTLGIGRHKLGREK